MGHISYKVSWCVILCWWSRTQSRVWWDLHMLQYTVLVRLARFVNFYGFNHKLFPITAHWHIFKRSQFTATTIWYIWGLSIDNSSSAELLVAYDKQFYAWSKSTPFESRRTYKSNYNSYSPTNCTYQVKCYYFHSSWPSLQLRTNGLNITKDLLEWNAVPIKIKCDILKSLMCGSI